MSRQLKLTQASGYDVKNMIFAKPESNTIPGAAVPISYKRISIGTVYDDGSTGDLIIPTERLFTFGVQQQPAMEAGKDDSYTMPICMWSKDGATPGEKNWTDVFDKIVEKCKDHILDVKDDIGKYDLERNDLKKLNPLYWKRDKGKIVDGVGPTLYIKLLQKNAKKNDKGESVEGKIITNFYDEDSDEQIDPLSLVGKYCYVRAAVKIESIFVGNKISLQVKLYEAYVHIIEMGSRRLLTRVTAKPEVTYSSSSTPFEEKAAAKPVVEDLSDSEEEDEPVPPPKTISKTKVVPAKKK